MGQEIGSRYEPSAIWLSGNLDNQEALLIDLAYLLLSGDNETSNRIVAEVVIPLLVASGDARLKLAEILSNQE